MGNRNSSSSKARGKATRVASTEAGYDPGMGMPVSKFREEYIRKPKAEKRGGVYSDNTPLDNDDTFTSFIQRAKRKIRTVSYIDREQSNVATAPAPAPPPADNKANGRDNQSDEFSSFIASAKKKLRSSSSMTKNGSFKRG